jgi:hypothetical protein
MASSDSARTAVEEVMLDHDKLASIPTYGQKKVYFERFVVKVDGSGFAMATIKGGCRMLKKSVTLKEEFAASGVVDVDGKPVSFITRWLSDPGQRRVGRVTYVPYPPRGMVPVLPGHFNMFRGFGRDAQLVGSDARRVRHLVRPWRLIGLQLCGGDKGNFDLLEQWLAHLVQFPAKRSNISFAFLGSKQGAFKNAFFAPLKNILGDQNYLLTTNIHDIVHTSLNRRKVACKLLCVLDEAKPQATKHFQEQLKGAVTDEEVSVARGCEEPYTVPAHHRLVVFSNNSDGLAVDYDSCNRRFVVFQPTDVLLRLEKQAESEFTSEYITRFVDPGVDECLNALYTHLATRKIEHRDPAQWKRAAAGVLKRPEKPKPPPQWASFLYKLTAPDSVPPVGEGVYTWETAERGFNVEVSRAALYGLYQGFVPGHAGTETQKLFTEHVICANKRAFYALNPGHAPPEPGRKIDNGTRTHVFPTSPLHTWLTTTFSALAVDPRAQDAAARRIESRMKRGKLFY